MTSHAPEIIEMDPAEFEELMRHAEQGAFEEGDYAKIRGVLKAYLYVLELVDKKSTSIARLRHLPAKRKLRQNQATGATGPMTILLPLA